MQSLFDDIVKLLATLGLHFHTLLRPLCTFGLHLGSFLRSLGTLGPLFGILFSTLGAQGQLCGLFWHTRGPKVEITKKETVLDPNNLLFWRPFGSLLINIEGVCACLFTCRVLVVFLRFPGLPVPRSARAGAVQTRFHILGFVLKKH